MSVPLLDLQGQYRPLREQVLVGNLGALTEALAAEERRRLLEEQSQTNGGAS